MSNVSNAGSDSMAIRIPMGRPNRTGRRAIASLLTAAALSLAMSCTVRYSSRSGSDDGSSLTPQSREHTRTDHTTATQQAGDGALAAKLERRALQCIGEAGGVFKTHAAERVDLDDTVAGGEASGKLLRPAVLRSCIEAASPMPGEPSSGCREFTQDGWRKVNDKGVLQAMTGRSAPNQYDAISTNHLDRMAVAVRELDTAKARLLDVSLWHRDFPTRGVRAFNRDCYIVLANQLDAAIAHLDAERGELVETIRKTTDDRAGRGGSQQRSTVVRGH